MRRFAMVFVIFLGFFAVDLKKAAASERDSFFSASLNGGFVGGFDLKQEFALDAVVIYNVRLPSHFFLFMEAGIGATFADHHQTFTLPLGVGMLYGFDDTWKIGVALNYCSRLGHFAEGSFAAAPILQRTLVRHSGPFGEVSGFLAAGMAGQVHPGLPVGFGFAGTVGVEFEFEDGSVSH